MAETILENYTQTLCPERERERGGRGREEGRGGVVIMGGGKYNVHCYM